MTTLVDDALPYGRATAPQSDVRGYGFGVVHDRDSGQ